MKEIVFYKTITNKNPVKDFLDSLSSKEAQKVVWVLKLIEDLPQVPRQYFKKLANTDDIWEVRVNVEKKAFRILCFFDGINLIVLAHAIQKKTQKTPRQAIRIAQARKKDYFQRRYGEYE